MSVKKFQLCSVLICKLGLFQLLVNYLNKLLVELDALAIRLAFLVFLNKLSENNLLALDVAAPLKN